MITASYGTAGHREVIRITIDVEGAEYIADVLEGEYVRTVESGVNFGRGDMGPKDIADALRSALAVRDEVKS